MRRELDTVTGTCATLKEELLAAQGQIGAAQDEAKVLSTTLKQVQVELSASEAARQAAEEDASKNRIASDALAQEKHRAQRLKEQVRELRQELLNVGYEADKRVGEERGAKEAALKEAQESKKQLEKSFQKYASRSKRVEELKSELNKTTRVLAEHDRAAEEKLEHMQSLLDQSYAAAEGDDGSSSAAELFAATSTLSERVRNRTRSRLGMSGSSAVGSPRLTGPPLSPGALR